MNTLKAEKRDMTTKAKKLRREGYVTGVIYGREMKESIPLQMEKPAVERILKTNGKGSQVMLEVGGETYDALIKEIDYDSLKGQLLEIDFQALVSNEKVHSVAEIILLNHEAVQAGVVQQMLQEVSYKALPAALVDKNTAVGAAGAIVLLFGVLFALRPRELVYFIALWLGIFLVYSLLIINLMV